ncbi:MAG: type II secretion system F family protein [Lachnospiraceae bacterium]|nr:type II secretion system F family protein [Lachnospiraceae bacterium]
MKYSYLAVDSKSKKYRSEMVADSRDEVKRKLAERGMTAIEISEAVDPSSAAGQENLPWYQRDIGAKDIHDVVLPKKKVLTTMNQMGIMMRSGISLAMAMEVLLDTEGDKQMKRILTIISSELYNGVPLSQSFASFKTFPEIVNSLVAAGEANGRLDMAFENASEILHREITLASKIKSAMMYPIFLIVLTVAMIIVMSMFVLPSFASVFLAFGSDLPLISKMVMAFSDWMVAYWWIALIIVVAVVVGFRYLLHHNEAFAMWLAEFLLKFPIIGDVMRNNYIARFCNIMATLTDAGVSILRALELARDVVSNIFLKDCLNQIIEDVKIGTPINVSMSHYPVFDSILVSMVRVGEESGMFSDAMHKMADLYQEQADESTKRLTDAMTPVMTVIVAGIVGIVAVSIVTPMFGMYSVVAESN